MFDKEFDEPSYDIGRDYDSGPSYSGDEYGKQGGLPFDIGDTKKIAKFAIIGIVILVIIFFAFNYINNQQTLTFELREKDGGTINNERLIIYDSANNPIYNESGSTHVITLPAGTYSYKVNSLKYKPLERSFDVSGNKADIVPVNLYKDIDYSMEIIMPSQSIYVEQTISGTLNIINDGDGPISNEKLIADSDFFNIDFVSDTINLNSGGQTGIDFSIKVKEDEEVQEEEEKEIGFRLKGGNDTESTDILVLPAADISEVDFSEDLIEEDGLTAGENELLDDITIENNSNYDLQDVLIEIIPNPNFESKLNWFEFGNYTEETYKKLIPRIKSDEEASFSLTIKPPISEQIESEFRGILKASSLSLKEDIEIEIILKVDDKKKAGIQINAQDYSTTCIAGSGSCEPINTGSDASYIENVGDVTIENINISLLEGGKANDFCGIWITLLEKNIKSLEPDKEKVIAWNITPTDQSEGEHICYINYSYTNPFNPSETISEESDPILINVEVETPDN